MGGRERVGGRETVGGGEGGRGRRREVEGWPWWEREENEKVGKRNGRKDKVGKEQNEEKGGKDT